MMFKPISNRLLFKLPFCDCQYKIKLRVHRSLDIVPVQPQHKAHSLEAGPLIPIYKGMVLDDGMAKGSGFAEQVGIEILAAE